MYLRLGSLLSAFGWQTTTLPPSPSSCSTSFQVKRSKIFWPGGNCRMSFKSLLARPMSADGPRASGDTNAAKFCDTSLLLRLPGRKAHEVSPKALSTALSTAMAMGFDDRRAKSCEKFERDVGRDGGRTGNCGNDDVLYGDVGVPGASVAHRDDTELCPSKLAFLRLCGVAVGEQAVAAEHRRLVSWLRHVSLKLFGEADGEHGKLSARSNFFSCSPLALLRLCSIAVHEQREPRPQPQLRHSP